MLSLEHKRILVNNLAYEVIYDCGIEDDVAHSILDGGYYGDSVIEGKTSLKDVINFDILSYENQIDNDIKYLKQIILNKKKDRIN